MKTAAIYDVHGNIHALEAVLRVVAEMEVEQVIFGGDLVLGPFSTDCLEAALALAIPTAFIHGNCESLILSHIDKGMASELPPAVQEDIHWTSEQLTREQITKIRGWPMTVEFTLLPGKILFCHATPRDDSETFTLHTPESDLIQTFESIPQSIVVCGHTHMQFMRRIGTKSVINAGSVGMPYSDPRAQWLLIDDHFHLMRTPYDYTAAAKAVRLAKYPHAEQFASNHILSAPNPSLMLKC